MTDYHKLKVAELKDELKARGIPLTGLKLKQNFIDKLIEADALRPTNPSGAADHAEATDQDAATEAPAGEARQESALDGPVPVQPVAHEGIANNGNHPVFPSSATGEMDVAADEVQSRPATSAEIVPGAITHTPVMVDSTTATSAEFVPAAITHEPVMVDSTIATSADDATAVVAAQAHREPEPEPEPEPVSRDTLPPSCLPAPDLATSTPPVPVKEWIEDSKKRKRRSVTPPPSAADVAQKRARASDGSPRTTKAGDQTREDVRHVPPDGVGERASKQTQPPPSVSTQTHATTDDTEPGRGEGIPTGEHSERGDATATIASTDEANQEPPSERPSSPVRSPEKQSAPLGPSVSLFAGLKRRDPDLVQDLPEPSTLAHPGVEERAVAPALHPATSSLYMRNFKRPLHLPTLRAHLARIARGPASTSTSDDDPIVAYFLDSIRTHALISFRSISAASRVRAALHDTRYPDEKTRDPLWIDFVPDDKVPSWIDMETRAGAHGGAQRWEVVYDEGPSGVDAVLQEVGASAAPRRPPPLPQKQPSTSGVQPPPSMPDVHTRSPVAAVHPDRLPRGPQLEPGPSQARRDHHHGASLQETSGTGFRALDELFSHTAAKPKLYYKPVAQRVADQRMAMIKDLRVGHADMGKSGDEDMKRYSFEVYRGGEEWVDKGPEFGYGRRGVERMRGGAPLRGAYRGGGPSRGGYRDRERDDAWRGRR